MNSIVFNLKTLNVKMSIVIIALKIKLLPIRLKIYHQFQFNKWYKDSKRWVLLLKGDSMSQCNNKRCISSLKGDEKNLHRKKKWKAGAGDSILKIHLSTYLEHLEDDRSPIPQYAQAQQSNRSNLSPFNQNLSIHIIKIHWLIIH